MYNYYDFEKSERDEDFVKFKKNVEELKSQQETNAREIVSLKSMLDELKKNQEKPDNTFAEFTLSVLSSYVKQLHKSYGITNCSNCGEKGHDITTCTEECKGNCPRSFKSHIPCKCPFQKVNSSPPNVDSHKDNDLIEPMPNDRNWESYCWTNPNGHTHGNDKLKIRKKV
jgi:hypothetical protein